MVSSSDTAKQVSLGAPKLDVLKTRAGHGDDAFRQIFAEVAKSKDAVPPEPQKDDSDIRDLRVQKNDAPDKIRSKKDDTKADKKDDGDRNDRVRSADAGQTKPEKLSVRKKDATDKKDDSADKVDAKDENDKQCDATSSTDTTVVATQDPVTPAATDAPAPDITADASLIADANSDTAGDVCANDQTQNAADQDQNATQNALNLLNQAATAKPQVKDTQDVGKNADKKSDEDGEEKTAASPQLAEQIKSLTFRPAVAAQPDKAAKGDVKDAAIIDTKDETKQSTAQSDIVAEKKADKAQDIPQELRNALKDSKEDDASANAAFSKLLEQAKNYADAQTAQTDKKQDVKDAGEKHASVLDMLQTAASAEKTPPAASDRAISVAFTAAGSPAPAQNGSPGGGSPLPEQGAGLPSAHGITGLENIRAQGAAEPAGFAGSLRSVKETSASLMQPSEQVAVQLHHMAKSGGDRYDLQLHPAELGRVDIRLDIAKDGTVMATITADNQQAYDMLQKDSRSLERALQQAGLQTDSGSLNFNLRGGDSQQAQQQQTASQQNGAWSKWMDKTLPEDIQTKTLVYDTSGASGRINLMV